MTISKAPATLPEAREKTTCHGKESVSGEEKGPSVRPRGTFLPSWALCSARVYEKITCYTDMVMSLKTGDGRPTEVRQGLWQVPGWGYQPTSLRA